MRRAAFLLAAVLLLGSARSGPASKPDPAIAACDAATAFAEREIGRRKGQLVFSPDSVGMGIPPGQASYDFGRFEWNEPVSARKVPPPPQALMAALYKLDSQSSISGCPSLRAMLDARHIGYGEQAVAHAQEKGWIVISMSMPAASENEAVFAEAEEMGPLNGSSDLYLLRRNTAGKWRVAGFSQLWIS